MSTAASSVPVSRRERRLLKPITVVEALLLVVSIAATIYAFPRAWGLAYRTVNDLEGYAWFFALALLGMAVPGFVIPFLLMLVTPWRYKIVAGVLSVFVLIYWGGRLLVGAFPGGFWALAGEVARFAFLMSGALGALLLWGALRERKLAGAVPFPTHAPDGPQSAPPRTPVVLQILAMLSIPAIYVGILAGALITVGIGILLTIVITEASRVPIWLIVVAYGAPIAALLGATSALYHAFFPEVASEPAIPVNRDTAPALWKLVSEVCDRIDTKQPDHIILHALPSFYVMQGRLRMYNRDEIRGRILAVGAPVLRQLSTRELKSILAHEFAHFTGRDTAYSAIGARAYSGLGAALRAIGSGGDIGGRTGAALYFVQIPAVKYIVAYYRYLMSLNAVISRRRELRADWHAAHLYGATSFRSGLEKAVGIGAHFGEAIKSIELAEPTALYETYARYLRANPDACEEHVRKALDEGETEFSSHPRLEVRLEAAALVPPAAAAPTESAASTESIVTELHHAESVLAAGIGAAVMRYQEDQRAREVDAATEEEDVWDGSLDEEE